MARKSNKKVVDEPEVEVEEPVEQPRKGKKSKKVEEEPAEESPETEHKKKSRRQPISGSGIRRILLSEAQSVPLRIKRNRKAKKEAPAKKKKTEEKAKPKSRNGPIRVSGGAISAAYDGTLSFLTALRTEVTNRLRLSDKKTVTEQLILDIFEGRNGVCSLVNLGLRSREISTGRTRNIALSGVLKIFREKSDFIVTSMAKKYILNAVVAFLASMGRDAAHITRQAFRSTITESDVSVVCTIKYTV